MTGVKTWPSIQGALTPVEVRKQLAGQFVQNADGTVRGGVLSGRRNVVTTLATRNVGVGIVNLVRPTDGGLGALLGANESFETLAIAAAPAAGTSRIDLIWARANDSGSGQSNSNCITEFGVQTGTAAASNPQVPALPAGAEELATLLFPAGATTTQSAGVVLTESSRLTAATGGVVELRSQAQMDAFSAAEGQRVRRIDTTIEYVRESGAWVPFASAWINFTPTWSAPTAPSLSNGVLLAKYRFIGRKHISVRYYLRIGSSTTGGSGGYTFTLPSGVTTPTASSNFDEQIIGAKGFVQGIGEFPGSGAIAAGSNLVRPFFPASITASYMGQAQNTNAGSSASGQGIPLRTGAYTWTSGSTIVMQGDVEIA